MLAQLPPALSQRTQKSSYPVGLPLHWPRWPTSFCPSCGVPVAIEIDPSAATDLPATHVIEIYRIVQEALGNVVRHAHADETTLTLDRAGRNLRVVIADDGIGFDPRRETRGLGLVGMRERTALMGGRLRIASSIGGGTRVELRVPLDEAPILDQDDPEGAAPRR